VYNSRKSTLRITLVLGTRPQIIKSSPFINLASRDKEVRLEIVHTGQHYDYEMTKIFFEELDLPDPDANLDVGSGTHAEQTARIMLRLEENWKKNKPELVLVPGDTNSTLAGALTAAKLTIPVAHMEAGARSYDMEMPEEINRRLTDHCSTQLFTPTQNCTRNLLREGIEKKSISETGDTMYDVLLQQLPKAEKSTILKELSLKKKTYALWTTHRPENVDDRTKLRNIVEAMVRLAPLTIVFPAHPRTQKELEAFDLLNRLKEQEHIRIIKPLGYHETLNLIQNACVVATDSGGMQKEAFWLKTPCVTIRKSTEWTETTEAGANRLTEADAERIANAVKQMIACGERIRRTLDRSKNPFGDGQASRRILAALKSWRT
jgi:UDP-N-acetylglucosamine 2-epimerase (non-hydrolysing)